LISGWEVFAERLDLSFLDL